MTLSRYTRRATLGALAAGAAAIALPARAQGTTRIVFGYTAVTAFASLFTAREEGYFSKRGLDVVLQLIPLNPSLPPAIQSDSIQMGGTTPSVYLQAVDGGLDHVAVASFEETSKSITSFGLVARAGSGIRTPQDCVGKKVGVPGLGAFLHVGFRAYLKSIGVDHTRINFVEAPFPQHNDLLRGGSLDAVVSGDPFMSRITSSGNGHVVSYYSTFLPEGLPTILATARRDWVQKNAAAARGFREALYEGAVFVNRKGNGAKVREHIGKYIKLPPEVLAAAQIGPAATGLKESQLAWWADQMREQGMLKGAMKLGNLIV
ncbi:ABC transporter substrate-binding protein [Ramlibacter sp. AW1]|uniref:ABC transporter substrate-binding protein n=1 Tax=Ramlibacter aurantiacus TaxID=2801330 RepID=A0A937D856_9BURK|nr:ABC transporter substrate-binding protein [Ramlibacter aurantiacus]MBL0422693.1 ABC transporter substrate-binding protein [Ramlibacter aurantiacus]